MKSLFLLVFLSSCATSAQIKKVYDLQVKTTHPHVDLVFDCIDDGIVVFMHKHNPEAYIEEPLLLEFISFAGIGYESNLKYAFQSAPYKLDFYSNIPFGEKGDLLRPLNSSLYDRKECNSTDYALVELSYVDITGNTIIQQHVAQRI